MKIKYFILIIFLLSFLISKEELIMRDYIPNGRIDALVDNSDNQIYLIQLDISNDSLYTLATQTNLDLELLAGPSTYHRLMTPEDFYILSENISENYLKIIDNNYIAPETRNYWTLTLQGNQYHSVSGETSSSCMCIDSSDCLVVGYNDSWYNPLDYYGEASWSFVPPPHDEIVEARVYIAGAQCDDLPIWSETNMSVKNNSCNWSDFQATLSIENTINGPYIIPDELLGDIWCDASMQPVVGSEDNYNVDWVQVEFYYSCETTIPPQNFIASDLEHCDYVQLDWDLDEITTSGYTLYRDGNFVTSLDNNQNQYIDYFAQENIVHEYCLSSSNHCGESDFTCSYGSRKQSPLQTESIIASQNYANVINIIWEGTENTNYYNLYRDSFLLSVQSLDNLEYNDSFVEFGNNYEYCIESINDCGASNWNCDVGSLSVGTMGDINLDNTIDILDIVIILNFVLELVEPDEDEFWLSDMNTDFNLNILDIVLLVNIILSN